MNTWGYIWCQQLYMYKHCARIGAAESFMKEEWQPNCDLWPISLNKYLSVGRHENWTGSVSLTSIPAEKTWGLHAKGTLVS